VDWKEYEKEIYEHFAFAYPDATITHDATLMGNLSSVPRQIDVLVEEDISGTLCQTVIEGKYYTRRKIHVKDVETFIGLLNDVQIDRGILITTRGYSDAALRRAIRDDVEVELDILNFNELKRLQGTCAIPYAGKNGVLMPAPLGWVVDAVKVPGTLARLYRRGLTFEEAAKSLEFMYINLWDKDDSVDSIDKLLALQEQEIASRFPQARFDYGQKPLRKDATTCVRIAHVDLHPTPEYTGFVDFKEFIFFCVLFSPPLVKNRNLRKLEYVLRKVLPLSVREIK